MNLPFLNLAGGVGISQTEAWDHNQEPFRLQTEGGDLAVIVREWELHAWCPLVLNPHDPSNLADSILTQHVLWESKAELCGSSSDLTKKAHIEELNKTGVNSLDRRYQAKRQNNSFQISEVPDG